MKKINGFYESTHRRCARLLEQGYGMSDSGYAKDKEEFFAWKERFEKLLGKDNMIFCRARSDTKGFLAWELYVNNEFTHQWQESVLYTEERLKNLEKLKA